MGFTEQRLDALVADSVNEHFTLSFSNQLSHSGTPHTGPAASGPGSINRSLVHFIQSSKRIGVYLEDKPVLYYEQESEDG